jgi:hypothetical protein
MARWIVIALVLLGLMFAWSALQNNQTGSPPIIPPAAGSINGRHLVADLWDQQNLMRTKLHRRRLWAGSYRDGSRRC